MKLVLQYFYKKRQVIGWSILCGLIYLLIFSLSGIDLKAAVYPALLCLVFGIVFLLVGFFRLIERHRRLEFLEKDKGPYGESLPKAADLCEADYQKLLKKEEQEWRDRQKVWDDTMSDMEETIMPPGCIRSKLRSQSCRYFYSRRIQSRAGN